MDDWLHCKVAGQVTTQKKSRCRESNEKKKKKTPKQPSLSSANTLRILLLQSMRRLLLVLTRPPHSKALAHIHIRPRLSHQRIANILLRPPSPIAIVLLAQGPNRHITASLHEFAGRGRRLRGDGVNVEFEFFAVGFEGEVVYVVAKGVFDFAANGGEADDDVGCEDAAWDCDPAEVVPELEGEHEHVDPGDLGDGDGVGDWEGGLEDAVHAG
jgi:hypothetical protein